MTTHRYAQGFAQGGHWMGDVEWGRDRWHAVAFDGAGFVLTRTDVARWAAGEWMQEAPEHLALVTGSAVPETDPDSLHGEAVLPQDFDADEWIQVGDGLFGLEPSQVVTLYRRAEAMAAGLNAARDELDDVAWDGRDWGWACPYCEAGAVGIPVADDALTGLKAHLQRVHGQAA